METPGKRIAAVRKASGHSQEEMARRFEVSKAAICRYEKDKVSLDVPTLIKFAKTCGFGTEVARWIGFGGKAPTRQIGACLSELLRDHAARVRKGAA